MKTNEEIMIDEDYFHSELAFKCCKRAVPVAFEIAIKNQTISTLEGDVECPTGHYIMTGPKGERYPISGEKFATLYTDAKDGMATPRVIVKVARLADHNGKIETSWGSLAYTINNDFIVRHGDADYGVVKRDIFQQTYERVMTA